MTDHYNAENWSLSKTLEYAFDDYCIAEMANKMGKKEIADEFYKRSQNYKNVYNPATSFMQPRDDKGNFIKDFKADEYTPHICESNGWQYFWSVQHDIDGLIDLTGAQAALQRNWTVCLPTIGSRRRTSHLQHGNDRTICSRQ